MDDAPNFETCKRCGKPLSGDDIPIYRKMISRSAASFFCMDCLAWYCNTTRERIEEYIAYLRKTGICTLFPPKPGERD